MIRKLILPLLVIALQTGVGSGQPLLKETRHPAIIKWRTKSLTCNTLCITGDCDKAGICANYAQNRRAYQLLPIDSAFYVEKGQLFLKGSWKKYFLGNSGDARGLALLDDEDDRLFLYLTGIEDPKGQASVQKIYGKPVGLKELQTAGDLMLCKLPADFPAYFEIGLEQERFCSKGPCEVWSPYHRMVRLTELPQNQVTYPVVPYLLDTLSVGDPGVYGNIRTLKLNFPFSSSLSGFNSRDARNMLISLGEPTFTISKIRIIGTPSMLGDSIAARQHFNQLANSLSAAFKSLPEGTSSKSEISSLDPWSNFKRLLRQTLYYRYIDSGEKVTRRHLNADAGFRNQLTHILQEQQLARIELDVKFDTVQLPEVQYWKYKLLKAVKAQDPIACLLYQKALIRMYGNGKINAKQTLIPEIPNEAEYLNLFSNYRALEMANATTAEGFSALLEIDPNHPVLKFNQLAFQLNMIRELHGDSLRDGMINLVPDFNSINSSSINKGVYQTVYARFYPYLIANKKEFKLLTYASVYPIIKSVSANEAIKIADDFASYGRFDLAYQILKDFLDSTGTPELRLNYAYRILGYAPYSGSGVTEQAYVAAIQLIQQVKPGLLTQQFKDRLLPVLLLANPEIRKAYQQGN